MNTKTPLEEIIEKSHELMGLADGNAFNQWFVDNEDRLLKLDKEYLRRDYPNKEK